jgi:hypothetical protein
MKKTILICGVIAGLISISMFIGLMIVGHKDHDWENGMLYGYTLMLLGFSFIFVATKIIRDKYDGGIISFGKAFRIGLYITLIASTIYVGIWLIDYYFFMPDFMENYSARALEKLKASGATAAKIAAEKAEMDKFNEMYKNPFFNALLTYSEILPVGLLVSLISALLLKRKDKQPGIAIP